MGRVIAKTGAAVVAVAAPNVDYQGGWASFLLRGGDWSGIHAWEGKCAGCHGGKLLFLDDYAEHPDDWLHDENCTKCRAEEKARYEELAAREAEKKAAKAAAEKWVLTIPPKQRKKERKAQVAFLDDYNRKGMTAEAAGALARIVALDDLLIAAKKGGAQ